MNTICISNQKGGCGKTSLTHNVGCVIATLHEKKVLFVDVDGQANLTTVFGFNPDNVKSISELLTSKKKQTRDYIVKTSVPNVDLIPSNQHTFSAEKQLYEKTGREFVLSDALEQVREAYDYIFIDTPPNLGIITLNSLIASNSVILVYTASEFSLDGLSQILNALDEIIKNKRLNINQTKILGAIQNNYKSTTRKVNAKLKDALAGVSDIPKYFSPISETTELEKSQFEHQPAYLYVPNHKISSDFKTFAKELIACLG
ncbi:MAG: ParA family protein [Nitrospirae bacterium]|nr:ParA family protein [Nitrospirota bacterium]MBF0554575.1 ParA family protein [Nitrospirota bacterium]